MFWPLHGHLQGGLLQRNTQMADSVKDVHMCSQNTVFSIKIAKSIQNID